MTKFIQFLFGAVIALACATSVQAAEVDLYCFLDAGPPLHWAPCGTSGTVPLANTPQTPAGGSQFGLAITSSTALTPPGGATYARVCVSGGNANTSQDLTQTPTGSVGTTFQQNQCIPLFGIATIAAFRAIQQTGSTTTLNVEYWKP